MLPLIISFRDKITVVFFVMLGSNNKAVHIHPKYNWDPYRIEDSNGIENVTLTEAKDYENTMYDFNRMPERISRYGKPAGRFKSGTVKNLGFRRSEQGIYVGSVENPNPITRREPHTKSKVIFDGIYSDSYGSSALTVDALASTAVLQGQFMGRYGGGRGGAYPGESVCMQVDGGRLELQTKEQAEIIIQNATTALSVKANSIVICQDVDFVNCRTAIIGDGLDNPHKQSPFFNGDAGACIIYVKDCRFWNCTNSIVAQDNCTVYVEYNNEVFGKKNNVIKKGGNIILGKTLLHKFLDHVDKLRNSELNYW